LSPPVPHFPPVRGAKVSGANGDIRVAVVGKYVEMPDSYISVTEALRHAALHCGAELDILWVNSEELDADATALLGVDGIVVPGGFGHRGIEGKVLASRHARRHSVPYLGLCLGMQCRRRGHRPRSSRRT